MKASKILSMKYTIIIPHYKTGKMTAYCLHQILKHSDPERIQVIVVSNSGDEGLEDFAMFHEQIELLIYPQERMQSHGLAFDYALRNSMYNKIDWFITLESDSFPVSDDWLDYYDNLIAQGYDMAASKMQLSGGRYYHPAGALYRFVRHLEALYDVDYKIPYRYYPNYLIKDGFPCHIMEHEDYQHIPKTEEIHHSYKGIDPGIKAKEYRPIADSVFHQGMGAFQESFQTYGQRTEETDGVPENFSPTERLIYRMGYEPGQWFGYWHRAMGYKIKEIPTQTVWMKGRENQQQEYTLTENGVQHLWGVTAYGTSENIAPLMDIISAKREKIETLYSEMLSELKSE